MSSVGAGKYALLQSETGETLLNCAAGQNIGFRCDNADKAYMNSDGCFFLTGSTSLSSPGYGFLNSLGNVGRSTGTNPYGLVVSARVAAGEFNATSDARVKEEVAAFRGDLCLDLVKRLAVRHYKYRPDGHYKVGVVAQEVERVFPNCVSQIVRDDVPDFRVVDYNQLTALLLGAVQELSRRVEESRPQS